MLELTIVALLLFIGIQEYYHRQETRKLIDRILAKSLDEVKFMEEPTAPLEDEELKMESEFMPLRDLTDEQFDELIKTQLDRESVTDKAKKKLKEIAHGKAN